jgi:hypothetical protein
MPINVAPVVHLLNQRHSGNSIGSRTGSDSSSPGRSHTYSSCSSGEASPCADGDG